MPSDADLLQTKTPVIWLNPGRVPISAARSATTTVEGPCLRRRWMCATTEPSPASRRRAVDAMVRRGKGPRMRPVERRPGRAPVHARGSRCIPTGIDACGRWRLGSSHPARHGHRPAVASPSARSGMPGRSAPGPVQVALVACGYAAAISSNVMTVPNFEACEPYSGSFDALHSSTVAAAECGRTAFGADLTQHSARVA